MWTEKQWPNLKVESVRLETHRSLPHFQKRDGRGEWSLGELGWEPLGGHPQWREVTKNGGWIQEGPYRGLSGCLVLVLDHDGKVKDTVMKEYHRPKMRESERCELEESVGDSEWVVPYTWEYHSQVKLLDKWVWLENCVKRIIHQKCREMARSKLKRRGSHQP